VWKSRLNSKPGFVDVHTHGAFGVNSTTMDHEDLHRWEKELY